MTATDSPRVTLGRTGLRVSRVGFGSSMKAPASSYEAAFERGINYFYWGSLRRQAMANAIRVLAPRHRSELCVVVQSYARQGIAVRISVERALKRLRLDQADILLLGWHNSRPGGGVLDAAKELVQRGLVHHIALSGHQRMLFPTLLEDPDIAAWHVRYNAVHRGAEKEVLPCLEGRSESDRPGLVSYTTTRWGHLVDPARTPPGERTPNGTDCLRFAISAPGVDLALSAPDTADHALQAMEAQELGPLDDEELAWMRRVGDHIYQADRTTRIRD